MQAIKKTLKIILSILFWVAVWHIAATGANKNLLLPIPTPVETVKTLFNSLNQPLFYKAIFLSVSRIFIGFIAALVVGLICAVLSNFVGFFKDLFSPLLKIIRAVPVASFIILVFLWMSRENVPSFIAFLTVLPIIWTNVYDGICATDRSLIEMALTMGMKRSAVLKHVMIPAALPFIKSAVSTGLGFAWKAGVAAEIICNTQNSLGNLIASGKNSIAYEEVFAATIVVIILSVLFEHGISALFGRAKK